MARAKRRAEGSAKRHVETVAFATREVYALPSFVQEEPMADSVYKIIELVGTSKQSWEKAAESAVKLASKSLRDLRIAEVTQLDMTLDNGKVLTYRAKLKVSFKYEGGG